MDLAGLRSVVAVADELHFGRAAKRLGIAQPQVSQRVRRIEDELGFAVFDRDRHRVTVTSAGAQVVEHAREVLVAANRLDRVAAGLRTGTAGVVRVGAVGSAFFGPLTRLLAPCRATLPEVQLEVVELESPQQVAALREGTIDLGILRPPTPSDLDMVPVWSEPLMLAVPADSDLANLEVVEPAALSGRRVVLFPREAGPGYWDRVAMLLSDSGALVEPIGSADHITTLLGTVALGVGATVVPASMRALALPGVVYRPWRDPVDLQLALASTRGGLSLAATRVQATLARTDGQAQLHAHTPDAETPERHGGGRRQQGR